jgi:arsenical-resistance protein 2
MAPPLPHIQEWLDKYPAPKHGSPEYVDKEVVAKAIKNDANDFIIIDLRKDDYKGGKIKGSLNIPAQSFYHSVEDIHNLAKQSGKGKIYLHCMSSRDRAVRTWGWLADTAEKHGSKVKPLIIEGGILAWIAGGKEYTDLMDEYDPAAWSA